MYGESTVSRYEAPGAPDAFRYGLGGAIICPNCSNFPCQEAFSCPKDGNIKPTNMMVNRYLILSKSLVIVFFGTNTKLSIICKNNGHRLLRGLDCWSSGYIPIILE